MLLHCLFSFAPAHLNCIGLKQIVTTKNRKFADIGNCSGTVNRLMMMVVWFRFISMADQILFSFFIVTIDFAMTNDLIILSSLWIFHRCVQIFFQSSFMNEIIILATFTSIKDNCWLGFIMAAEMDLPINRTRFFSYVYVTVTIKFFHFAVIHMLSCWMSVWTRFYPAK